MIKLPATFKAHLATLPESGMGYQNVDILMNNGKLIEHVPVFNGEDISDLRKEWTEINPDNIIGVSLSVE